MVNKEEHINIEIIEESLVAGGTLFVHQNLIEPYLLPTNGTSLPFGSILP